MQVTTGYSKGLGSVFASHVTVHLTRW